MGQTQISGAQIVKQWILGATAFTLVGGGSAALFRILNQSEQPVLYVEETGNVGIGTEDPDAKLEVIGTVSGSDVVSSNAMSPLHLAAQVFNTGSTLLTGSGWLMWQIPSTASGYVVNRLEVTVHTPGTTNVSSFDITNKDKGNRKIFSTAVTIDSNETSWRTAATPAVVNSANDDVGGGDRLLFNINALSTTKPKGLSAVLILRKP